jgi:hypothetical protein
MIPLIKKIPSLTFTFLDSFPLLYHIDDRSTEKTTMNDTDEVTAKCQAMALLQELKARGFGKAVTALEREIKKKFLLATLPSVDSNISVQFQMTNAADDSSSSDSSDSSDDSDDYDDDNKDNKQEKQTSPTKVNGVRASRSDNHNCEDQDADNSKIIKKDVANTDPTSVDGDKDVSSSSSSSSSSDTDDEGKDDDEVAGIVSIFASPDKVSTTCNDDDASSSTSSSDSSNHHDDDDNNKEFLVNRVNKTLPQGDSRNSSASSSPSDGRDDGEQKEKVNTTNESRRINNVLSQKAGKDDDDGDDDDSSSSSSSSSSLNSRETESDNEDESPPTKKAKVEAPLANKISQASAREAAEVVTPEEGNSDGDSDSDVSDVEVSSVSTVSTSEDDSDSDQNSDSSSDSSSDDESEDLEAKMKAKRQAAAEKAKQAAAAALAWTPKKTKADSIKVTTVAGTDGAQVMSKGKPFQRVDDSYWGEKAVQDGGAMADNSYENIFGESGFGARSSEKLLQVRGKRFQHEKTKRKRSFNGLARTGGKISMESKSTKYASD